MSVSSTLGLSEEMARRAQIVRKRGWMEKIRDCASNGQDSVMIHLPMYKNHRAEFEAFLVEVQEYGFKVHQSEKLATQIKISWADNELCENLKDMLP